MKYPSLHDKGLAASFNLNKKYFLLKFRSYNKTVEKQFYFFKLMYSFMFVTYMVIGVKFERSQK